MIEFLYALSPFLLIFLSAILSLGLTQNAKVSQAVTLGGLITSLLANTILLLILKAPVQFRAMFVSLSGLWLIEIFLIGILIVFLSVKQNLANSLNNEIINPCYLIFASGVVGLFCSENVLIITAFYMLIIAGLAMMYFFGPYKKKLNTLNNFLVITIAAVILIIITDIIVYDVYHTLELSVLRENFDQQPLNTQIFVFCGYLIGFGGIGGMVPFTNWHLKGYFSESNPINLRLITNIFFPLNAIILLRVISVVPLENGLFGNILYVIGSIGFILGCVQCFIELFGKSRDSTRAIPKILGYFSIVEFNIYLLLGALLRLSFFPDRTMVSSCIFQFLILSIFGKAVMIEALSPIFDMADEWDLNVLGGFSKYYPKFLIFFFIVPIFFALPGSLGYLFLNSLLQSAFATNIESPIQTAQLWSLIVLIVGYLVILFIIIVTIMTVVFLGKPLPTQREIVPRPPKIYYYTPILFISAIIAFNILLSNTFPLSTEILAILNTTFFF